MQKRVAFFSREFDDPFYPAQKQVQELHEYCIKNNLKPISELTLKFMDLNPESQYSLPLMEQEKIKEMLQWFDNHPGEIDSLLVCSLAHLSKSKKEIEAFRRELANRHIELISLATGERRLKPLGITEEHGKIIRQYWPSVKKIYQPLETKKWKGNLFDLRDMTIKILNQEKEIYEILKKLLVDENFYRFGARGKVPSRPKRFFLDKVYNAIFVFHGLHTVKRGEVEKWINKNILKQNIQ